MAHSVDPSTSSRSPLAGALIVAGVSGATALAHQLLWTRRLVDFLGAGPETFSRVVGAFFVGLALGSWIASRLRPWRGNPWLGVAVAELGVALLALPTWVIPGLDAWFGGASAPGAWLAWLPPVLLILPPATAMGLTLPWMVAGLQAHPRFAPRHAVWIYSFNTAGAILGIALVMGAGLPRLGLAGSGAAAIACNILVAAGALLLAPGFRPAGALPAAPDPASAQQAGWHNPESESPRRDRWLALASGALVLGLEVILQHQLAQVTVNSLYSSALVLTLVLLALAAGAALVPVLVRRVGTDQAAMRVVLPASAALCVMQPFVLLGLRGGLNILPYELPPAAYAREVITLGLVAVCPMLVAGGMLFPLLLRRAAQSRREGTVGQLLVWNGLGGWLGAEAAQLWLAPQLGLWSSVVALGGVYALLAASLRRPYTPPATGDGQSPRLAWFPVSLGLVAAGVIVGFHHSRALPQAGVGPTELLAAVAVGREGVVATLECGPGDWRMLFNNSYTLGGSKAQFNQERQALLPLLLHPAPKTVATLGVATGGSVAGARLHPVVTRVDAIELSPLVLAQAREYFGPYNREVLSDPSVRSICQDARRVMAAHPAEYDVVVGDLFLPWRTGEARLYSREHFARVRRALKPGGLFCQWLPLFQLTRPQFDAILRTFRAEFPVVTLLRGDFYTDLPIVGLVGGIDPAGINWPRMRESCEQLRRTGRVTDPLARHAEGVAMLILGPAPDPGPGPVNTLDNAWLEWDAGRNILGLQAPWLVGIPAAEYFRSVHRSGVSQLPDDLRAAHDAGQFFLTLEIAAKLNLPALAELARQAIDRLPPPLRTDAAADWRQWPTRVKPEVNGSEKVHSPSEPGTHP